MVEQCHTKKNLKRLVGNEEIIFFSLPKRFVTHVNVPFTHGSLLRAKHFFFCFFIYLSSSDKKCFTGGTTRSGLISIGKALSMFVYCHFLLNKPYQS